MKGPALLAHHAGVLRTRVGACWPGHRAVFRGHDLHRDLGGIGWLDLYLFGLTGRRFDAPQLQLLQDIWSMTSYRRSMPTLMHCGAVTYCQMVAFASHGKTWLRWQGLHVQLPRVFI